MEEKTNGLPRSFYMFASAAALYQLTRHTTQPIFTLYVLEMEASLLQLGFILSIQSILMIVVRIPLTLLAEKIGENRMLIIAFIIQATTPLLYAFAPNPTWLYFIPFYQIIATGSFNQLAMTTASNMAPANKQGDALGRYMTFWTMGMFVGPLITSFLLAYINYRQLYLTTALFPAIGLALFLRYIPKGETASSVQAVEEEDKPGTRETLKLILKNRNVMVLTLVRATFSLSTTVFTSLFPLYAVEVLGFTPSVASLLFSVVGFMNAFIKLPAGRIADRIGAKTVLIASFGTLILVYVSIAYLRGFVPVLISLALFGACWGSRAVTEWATLVNTVSTETKAMAMSYLASIWGIGATIGSMMVGLVGGVLPFSTIFLILALINVPAVPAIHIMKTAEEEP